MRKIKHFIERIINHIFVYVEGRFAKKALTSVKAKCNNDEINVGFLVFETQTWDKLKSIYDIMQKNKRFNLKIIACH